MLSAFSAYIQNIAVFLVFSSLVLLISPSEKSKSYIRLTLGFALILLAVKPLSRILNSIGNTNGVLVYNSNSITVPVFDVSAHDEIVLLTYEAELRTHLEHLVAEDDHFELLSSEFTIARDAERFGTVESIRMTLTTSAPEAEKKPFLRIEPIRIQTGPHATEEPAPDNPAAVALKNAVSRFYNLSTEHIHCIVQVNEREME